MTAPEPNVKNVTVMAAHNTIKTDPSGLLSLAPEPLRAIMARLDAASHRVWLVGGAIRDHLLGVAPHDWDLATTATPAQVTGLFPRVVPIGIRHGTVQVHTPELDVEITSCPAGLAAQDGIMADLARRDFTINAIAMPYPDGAWLDPHGGIKDLATRRLRTVGDARARFRDDPLRILRAARLVSNWGFRVASDTSSAMGHEVPGLQQVARERIREEMFKLLVGDGVIAAVELLRRTDALALVLPELLEGVRKKQNAYHRYDIYHHILYTVHYSPARIRVRLAALFHDIAKPRVRRRIRGDFRFYGHAKASSELAQEIMTRWRLPLRLMEEVRILTASHMLMDIDRWSDAAVRRLIARVGEDLLEDLLDLAEADSRAHGTDHGASASIEQLRLRIGQQLRQKPPLHVTDLAINGHEVMQILGLQPGPEVGKVLKSLRQKVLRQPELNERSLLVELLRQHDF
jgi:tRNA nucleotidyltransferase (CCA-adding enzyme)